jgi:hypothetical protein
MVLICVAKMPVQISPMGVREKAEILKAEMGASSKVLKF